MRKKLLAVLSLLFLLVLFNGSGSWPTDLIGKWILESDEYASLPMVQYMEFFDNGKGITIHSDNIIEGFTWTLNGNRLRLTYYDGTTYVYNIEIIGGTKLTEYYDDGSYAIYNKLEK